ncbi:FAD-dependent monooxygenase [Nonomuraea soli]|uniref:2-polyprenyl-6-methoxyphenol hydroxylase-like FAD-dependent oxidoreductase n=1 Tax=Nonomuraea soli TaxID=1032476 RepID=A0A7W0CF21_9ACTN|nr:FAD-dependent monooxygenase [Nonomuraea soli]MBA2889847.1 2-polyprenyl-6-methoxyphenol hydroxylase-like FAD-dependent oxidoreductase [Nonomuraea soli]
MTHVLIAGAGPTGLTLAIELARRGVDLRIVERSPEHPSGVRGKGLQPRTLEVFHDLGVIDEILATGSVYPPIRGYQDGRVVWEHRMHEPKQPSRAVPYPMVVMQPQWRTERILRERLAALGHHVELGTEVVAAEQDGEGVTVTLGGGERVRCAYLAGADGGRSTVRKLAGIGFHGETFETERMTLKDVRVDGLDRDHWHMWGDENGFAGLCPMPHSDVFQLTCTPGVEPPVEIREVLWESEYRVNIRMAERFRNGRIFLAGDAAHVHSPAGGQGLNTGVQDAYNLGWKLALGLDRVIDTYEAERMPVAEHVLGLSTRLLREQDLKRDEETQQLNLGYRDSPLSEGERGGERLPGRLEELRGTHFTLFGAAEIADPRVRVHPGEGFLLVRPDGYIGFDGDDESRLRAYLSGLGIVA